ncbi:MAG TPA: hypothetical protein VLV83_01675 [Acidobacteriota bacterium]|nr:hypothetical protein [Acidobacteriota bacterium]
MERNLNKRVETITPVFDEKIQEELTEILDVYERDNASAWDCQPDGTYTPRRPAQGEDRRAAQEVFIRRARESRNSESPADPKSADAAV